MSANFVTDNFYASVVEDSLVRPLISTKHFGRKYRRLTTFVVTFPRYILAEVNTHKLLSRNSASSRAIPFSKAVKRVKESPFVPIHFQKPHKGMQGTEYYSGAEHTERVVEWLDARDKAVAAAERLNSLGITKQLTNRVLEPFAWHTAIVTTTEYDNFFALRTAEGTEIHFQKLANMMLEQLNNHTPSILGSGDWHLPFSANIHPTRDDYCQLRNDLNHYKDRTLGAHRRSGEYLQMGVLDRFPKKFHNMSTHQQIRLLVSVARCARVSYLNFDGKDDYLSDARLAMSLAADGHWSPFEHQGQAQTFMSRWSGNFYGFTQFRKMFPLHVENQNKNLIRNIDNV